MADDTYIRTSIVTGGAGGIGQAVVRRLAARGDTVVVTDINEPGLTRLVEELTAKGQRCIPVIGDITIDETVIRTVAAAVEAGDGAIDVLVNNVGDFRPASKDFARSKPEQWTRLHELNLQHVFAMSHACLPHLRAGAERAGHAAIVNNSTVEAFRGIPGHAVYSAYNAGVSAFTKSLAVEIAPDGIRVNAIAPDLADTEQTPAEAMLRGRDPELIPTWVPVGRFGHPDEYAAVIEFLASDASSYVTGHTIPVDGGTLAASGWYGRVDGKGWTNMPDHA